MPQTILTDTEYEQLEEAWDVLRVIAKRENWRGPAARAASALQDAMSEHSYPGQGDRIYRQRDLESAIRVREVRAIMESAGRAS